MHKLGVRIAGLNLRFNIASGVSNARLVGEANSPSGAFLVEQYFFYQGLFQYWL